MLRAQLGGVWVLALAGCPTPNTVELGGACQEREECKAPAEDCVTALGKRQCSMVCTAEETCPSGFDCARMDITVTEAGPEGGKWTGERGYCLPDADVPPRAVTIRPKKRPDSRKGGGPRGKAPAPGTP